MISGCRGICVRILSIQRGVGFGGSDNTHVPSALDQVAAELNDDVIVVAQDVGNPSSNPSKHEARQLECGRDAMNRKERGSINDVLFHHLQVDFLRVHLLVEDGWELGALEELRVHAGRHGGQG